MFNCETNSPYVDVRVQAAFHRQMGNGKRIQTNFEHGQWWVTDLDTGAQWAVNDAQSDDFDFEQVSRCDED